MTSPSPSPSAACAPRGVARARQGGAHSRLSTGRLRIELRTLSIGYPMTRRNSKGALGSADSSTRYRTPRHQPDERRMKLDNASTKDSSDPKAGTHKNGQIARARCMVRCHRVRTTCEWLPPKGDGKLSRRRNRKSIKKKDRDRLTIMEPIRQSAGQKPSP